jgi:hypothetical protein
VVQHLLQRLRAEPEPAQQPEHRRWMAHVRIRTDTLTDTFDQLLVEASD